MKVFLSSDKGFLRFIFPLFSPTRSRVLLIVFSPSNTLSFIYSFRQHLYKKTSLLAPPPFPVNTPTTHTHIFPVSHAAWFRIAQAFLTRTRLVQRDF